MAEEHRCQAPPEGHRLCANNCGFFGSPATLNLCSKCFRDFRLKEEQASSAMMAVEKSFAAASSSSSDMTAMQPLLVVPEQPVGVAAAPAEVALPAPPAPTSQSNRCTSCRKRVGLMGFRCRCGEVFCGSHRYPEQHKCSFDFKSAGKEEIARSNPVVKAQKLDRI